MSIIVGPPPSKWIIRDPNVNRNATFTVTEKDQILITTIKRALDYGFNR